MSLPITQLTSARAEMSPRMGGDDPKQWQLPVRTDEPSGVQQRALGALVVFEPDQSERVRWDDEFGARVRYASRTATLGHAVALRRTSAIAVALPGRMKPKARAEAVCDLGSIEGIREMRVVVDARRCDLDTLLSLGELGAIICSDGAIRRGGVRLAAIGQRSMREHMQDRAARRRLANTLGATSVSDRLGLSAARYRILRAALDVDTIDEIASSLCVTASTVNGHVRAISQAAGCRLRVVVREAHDIAFDRGCDLTQTFC